MGALLLVRHGQASFGAADYDALSATGREQSRLLGAALARRGITVSAVFRGGLRRHEQTAAGLAEGYGPKLPDAEVDPGWDELDAPGLLGALAPEAGPETEEDPVRAFQACYEEATARWLAGAHPPGLPESYAQFAARVTAALDTAAGRPGTVLVVTSGGPLATVVSRLLAGDDSLWGRLSPVMVNTGVTKVVSGRRGRTCLTVNAHEHLEHDRGLLTYR